MYPKIPLISWFGRRKVSEKALMLVLSAGFLGGVVGYSQITHGSVDCSLYTSGAQVPAGYAAPYDVFSTTKDLFLKVACDTTSVTLTAGAASSGRYIYKYGYEWKDGAWKQYAFTGNAPVGDWFQGTASVQLSRVAEEMNGSNYIVAYTCQFMDNSWKCGCRDTACATPMWQMQGFKKPLGEGLPATAGLFDSFNGIMIAYPSREAAPPGARITITGAGFSTTNNTVKIGNRSLTGVVATSKNSIDFVIPSDMPPGLVDISVTNEKGTTRGKKLMVTTPGAMPPTITSITPTSGPSGTRVTIHGRGFTPTGNNLATGYAFVQDLPSSDGTTIVTTLNPFPNDPNDDMQKEGVARKLIQSYDFHIYLINTNGISPLPVVFTAKI